MLQDIYYSKFGEFFSQSLLRDQLENTAKNRFNTVFDELYRKKRKKFSGVKSVKNSSGIKYM